MLQKGKDNPTFQLSENEIEIQMQIEEEKMKESDAEKENDDTIFEDKESEGNFLGNHIETFWSKLRSCVTKYQRLVNPTLLTIVFILYNVYLVAALHHGITHRTCLNFCEDVGFLFLLTLLIYVGLAYFFIMKPFYHKFRQTDQGTKLQKSIVGPIQSKISEVLELPHTNILVSVLFLLALAIFIFVDTADDPSRLVSAAGILVLVLLGLLFSKHPGYIEWRPVLWGLGLQFLFGLLILRWEVGKSVFHCLGNKIKTFLDYTDAGSGFVFGYLVTLKPFNPSALNNTVSRTVAEDINNSQSIGFIFIFKVLSIIYFFNFVVSILFYLGTMTWVVGKVGWLLQATLGTTACESMNAAGNIFLGQTEAPLLIKPYLNRMTKSEIHAVMTGGFATIAGSVLAAYINFGIPASHLLSASVMSAPAALAFSKLTYPETKKSKTTAEALPKLENKSVNVLDAAVQGASDSVFLVGNIAASLVAFLAFIAFLNGLLGWLGGLLSFPCLSFELILSWLFYPLALIMGVPCGDRRPTDQPVPQSLCPSQEELRLEYEDECKLVGILVGLKTVVNEFVAYDKLVKLQPFLSSRSVAISTFALCGFSNPASVGIQISALSYMAEKRKGDISRVALRAFMAGSAACFLTACVAGTLIKDCGGECYSAANQTQCYSIPQESY